MDKPKKATIQHQLTPLKKLHPIQRITRECILRGYSPDEDRTWLATKRAQQAVRCQYYRAITDNPARALEFTYDLNCPPSGCKVEPVTRLCGNPRVCPWCFCRRALKVYDALMEPGHKIRNLNNLVFWQRTVPATSKLPFFRADYGPHTWLNASVTAQIVIPFYDRTTNTVLLNHMGFQLVPKTESKEDVCKKLKRLCVNPELNVVVGSQATQPQIFKGLTAFAKVPWSDLYLADNLEHFIKILDIYPNKQLLRISRYNPLRKK